MHRIWINIWWFPCQKYRIRSVHYMVLANRTTTVRMVLANPTHTLQTHTQTHTLLPWHCALLRPFLCCRRPWPARNTHKHTKTWLYACAHRSLMHAQIHNWTHTHTCTNTCTFTITITRIHITPTPKHCTWIHPCRGSLRNALIGQGGQKDESVGTCLALCEYTYGTVWSSHVWHCENILVDCVKTGVARRECTRGTVRTHLWTVWTHVWTVWSSHLWTVRTHLWTEDRCGEVWEHVWHCANSRVALCEHTCGTHTLPHVSHTGVALCEDTCGEVWVHVWQVYNTLNLAVQILGWWL